MFLLTDKKCQIMVTKQYYMDCTGINYDVRVEFVLVFLARSFCEIYLLTLRKWSSFFPVSNYVGTEYYVDRR